MIDCTVLCIGIVIQAASVSAWVRSCACLVRWQGLNSLLGSTNS